MQRNNVNLKQLRAFVVVADKGSFVGAAGTLHISQPALSQCIRQLEDQIGSPLFHRTTRRVHLTALGMSFLPHARHLLRQFDGVINDLRDVVARKRGRVVVACLPSVAYRLMPRVVAANERLHPGVRITVRDANLKGVIASVTSGEADLGIGSSAGDTPELASRILARDRFNAVFPRDFPLARKQSIRWRDLAGPPFVAMTNETGVRELVDLATERQGIRLNIVAEVSNIATLYGMLEEGIGISALPGLVLPRDDHSFIRNKTLADAAVERTIRVFWRAGLGFSPSAQALIEAMNACITEDAFLSNFPNVSWQPFMMDSVADA
jgi:DNA-binding transcriptional LysR family regulator